MPLGSKQPRVLGLVPGARDAEAGRGPPEVFVSERAPGPHRSGDHSTEPEEQALAGGLAEGDELDGRGDLLLAPYPGIAERRLLEPGQSGAGAVEGPGRGKVGV